MKNSNEQEYSFDGTELTSNMEDYIEQIEFLSHENKVVRVKDIAKNLHIKMPSVTAALLKLEEKGLINYKRYGYVELTEQGKVQAERVCARHTFLSDFFHRVLRIKRERADRVACNLEHHLTPEACRQFYKLVDYHQSGKKGNEPWITKLDDLMDERPLSDIQEGDTATILKVSGNPQLRKRLIEMGFKKGEKIKVVQYAPLKDPIKISIKDYYISLRVDEAKLINVKQEFIPDDAG
ncbi:MAG: metal-dependent transcriptional regulator [Spirochaetes bacterium]|jgi:DtxR family Mn-dependent transcriptional regulator|nr:metal-dependent transcriptional regulator [Spirochaetota bacterium]